MPANYVLLERIELNDTASSVTFANIPQSGYTDLKIVYSARSNDNSSGWNLTRVQFNTDTTAGNYNYRVLGGFGSTAYSGYGTQAVGYTTAGGRTANTFGNGEIYIPNYLGSTQKSYSGDSVTEGNGSTYEILGFHAALWSGTAAINQIILSLDNSASFVANSTFSLYGLAAVGTTPVIAPKASGGNRIDYDGTYWIHTFTTTGAFVPQTSLSCDYLVVAGGGGAGGGIGGGGGAGGLRSTVTATGGGGSLESALSVASGTSYTVTVGSGGAGGNNTTRGVSGSNSVFSSITSTGGGAAGSGQTSDTQQNGLSGGSGGGQGVFGGGGTNNAAGTANQGYQGGAGVANSSSGGGGGAGAVGANAATNVSGNGGAGVAVSISGSSVTYAGGGGGGAYTGRTAGTGGSGGGGNGTGNDTVGVSGTVNTGGGGGGGGYSSSGANGGNGGSGIVIIRYLAA